MKEKASAPEGGDEGQLIRPGIRWSQVIKAKVWTCGEAGRISTSSSYQQSYRSYQFTVNLLVLARLLRSGSWKV
jgi:hypothetical protein